jgi:glucosamine-6-phosphate deaminase
MEVRIAETEDELGEMAARDIAVALREKLQEQEHVRIVFAAAPSQSAMLASLLREPGIEWPRVTAFHMDEYLGLPREAPQLFGSWLTREFFSRVALENVHLIDPQGEPEAVCQAYASLLKEAPIDLVLLGIGINGHVAFNDPPADLHDPVPVRVVTLDEACRMQQVMDGCFADLEGVPRHAITLTVPMLMAGEALFCCVPGLHKSQAVKQMLQASVSGDCPATALRLHPHCTVYLDRESSSLSVEHARG